MEDKFDDVEIIISADILKVEVKNKTCHFTFLIEGDVTDAEKSMNKIAEFLENAEPPEKGMWRCDMRWTV